MKNPFSVGDIIEGLERMHSSLEGRKDTWHKLKVLGFRDDGKMILQMINDPEKLTFSSHYKQDWFRKI